MTKEQNIFPRMTAKGQSLESEREKEITREREKGGWVRTKRRKCKALIFPLYFLIKEILRLLQVTH